MVDRHVRRYAGPPPLAPGFVVVPSAPPRHPGPPGLTGGRAGGELAAVATLPTTLPEGAAGDPASKPAVGSSLGKLAVRGGAYLVGREAIGMCIRLAGVVVTVREIGPANYGIYSAAAAYVLFIAALAQLGAEIYLMRQPGTVEKARYDEVFTMLVCTSVAVTALALALTVAIGPYLRPHGVLLPLRVLLLATPINILWAPGQACIERRFGYRQMGVLEVVGDVALYGTAIPMAVLGFGAWSLVAGYIAWQTWLFAGSLIMSGLRPRWRWSRTTSRELIRHGLSYSSANWILRLRGLVNPLVVGTVAGAAGVGFVAFAQRLVDTVGFAQRGAYRLGLVAMSKVRDDEQHRLRYGLERGSLLQLIALAVPFACFGIAAHWVVPALFGGEWTRALPVYSLLALCSVMNASCLIQNTLLLSRGQNLKVAGGAAVQTAVTIVAAVVLVPAMGIDGFGLASVVALVDLAYTNHMVRRLTTFSYRSMVPFALALCPPVLMPLVPLAAAPLLFLPMAVAATLPSVRGELVRLATLVRSSLGPGTR
ncbi:MAG: oligosaccharide flippase family protein [Acidimicrobiales bacterium]